MATKSKKPASLACLSFRRGAEKKTCWQYIRENMNGSKQILVGNPECLYLRKDALTGVPPGAEIRVLIEVYE